MQGNLDKTEERLRTRCSDSNGGKLTSVYSYEHCQCPAQCGLEDALPGRRLLGGASLQQCNRRRASESVTTQSKQSKNNTVKWQLLFVVIGQYSVIFLKYN